MDEQQIESTLKRLVERGELTPDQATVVAAELRQGVTPGLPPRQPAETTAPVEGQPHPEGPETTAETPTGETPTGETPTVETPSDKTPSAETADAETAGTETPTARPAVVSGHPPGRLAEVAGYVGAALVVGAAILVLSQSWDQLGKGGRITVLFGIAVVLAVAGGLVAASAAGPIAELREGADPVRTRLASTLFSAAASAAAFAVGLATDTGVPDNPWPIIAAGVTGALLAGLGYYLAPAGIAQLVIVVALSAAINGILLQATGQSDYVGFVMLGVGATWAVLAAMGLLRERRFGAGLGALFALLGAQWTLAAGSLEPWIAYVLTALVAVGCFIGYYWIRFWPYLVVGVAGAMLAVTEFVLDITGGSLGAAGVLLVAGITLLAASALGLRLRRPVP